MLITRKEEEFVKIFKFVYSKWYIIVSWCIWKLSKYVSCDDDPVTCVCVCVRRHKMPTSQHASQMLVIKRALLYIADVSIVIGFPVSIQSTALYLLKVSIAVPLNCGRFRAFYGANTPSPIWPDHHLSDRCRVSVI